VTDLTFSPTPPNTSSALIAGRLRSSVFFCTGFVTAVCVATMSDSFLVYLAAADANEDVSANDASNAPETIRFIWITARTCWPL
jgi:hypothetical protein